MNVRVNQQFFDEASVRGQEPLAKQQQLPQVAPVATILPIEIPDLQGAEEVDRVCLDNVRACAEVQEESVLPEMLRLEGCIKR